MGLCHKCGSRKKFEKFQYCGICLEKIRQENAKYHPDEWYAERKEAINTRRRELYQEKKARGICVRCAKKATHGLYCLDHAVEAKRRSATRAQHAKNMRHDRGVIPQKRAENGLCLWCGQPAAGGTNACEYHRNAFSDAGKKGRGNEWNEQIFKLIFPASKRT